MKKRIVAFATIVLFAFVGCDSRGKNQNDISVEKNGFKIGAILPLTGNLATYGKSLEKGMNIAIDKINKIDRLVLVLEDGQGIPKISINAFNKLSTNKQLPLVIGCMFSAPTLSIAPIAEKEKIVLLSPTSSAVELSEAGDYIFRIYPSDVYDGKFLSEFATENLKSKKIAIIYEQTASITQIVNVFSENITKSGGAILFKEEYTPNTVSFKTILSKIKNINPDLIFFPGNIKSMTSLLINAKEIDLKTQFLTISTFYDEQVLNIAKDAAENVIFSTPMFDINDKNLHMVEFVKGYKEKYGTSPDILAGYGYDVVNIAYKAIKNSNNESNIIKDNLYKIKNYPGVTGITSFDENGDVNKELRMMIVKNNTFKVYE